MYRIYFAILFCFSNLVFSQSIVNAYARVSAISNNSIVTLTNVDQTNHTFNVGENIVIMQMQDDVIGSNTSNNSSFGNLSAIASAGRFEIKTILARNPSSGTPTSLTLASVFANTYNIGTNTSVQIISYRNLGSNFTTTANITGLAWTGSIGGVVAIEVTNTLTLNHSIIADGIGFRGGAFSAAADEACANTVYITNSNLKAFKGEGIYKNTNSNFTNGRGKMLNGGGGGSQNNAGGGGGANYTAGGDGGLGWTCTAANSGFGMGALSLSTSISGTRIFMGGGGGGGQQNNGLGTDGGAGGGIILISANTILTNNTCASSLSISAKGAAAVNSGNDGAGGGGGGGSIIIDANTFTVSTSCQLTVTANGGNGGSVTNSGSHGGGGGGGQGVVIYAASQPTLHVSSQVNNGSGGANNSGGSSFGGSGSGSSGAGVISSVATILPLELVDFRAKILNDGKTILNWATASEKNCKEFTLQSSMNALAFIDLSVVPAHGTSSEKNYYQAIDANAYIDVVYYRLKSTDFDFTEEYFPMISVRKEQKIEFSLSPNPILKSNLLIFHFTRTLLSNDQIQILNMNAQVLKTLEIMPGTSSIETSPEALGLCSGIYLVRYTSSMANMIQKLLVH